MRRIAKLALAAIVMTSSAVATSAIPAAAGDYGPGESATCVETTGARACYEAYGDRLWVLDTLADGHHAEAWLSVDGAGYFSCASYQGAWYWKVCDYAEDVPEHHQGGLVAERVEGKVVLNTSTNKWIYTT